MWRHGDVLIAEAKSIPRGAVRRNGTVLVRGEITGHSHRVAEPHAAEIWELGQELFLKITGDAATLVHEEHKPIMLPRGIYRVWVQREYTPAVVRRIVD